jgi:uncharacterized membrane protein YeaQ/YmgE (transglycosylase-associated protein family)
VTSAIMALRNAYSEEAVMEYAFQMGPMLLVGALMVGLLAEATWRSGGYGLITDLMIGLGGSVVLGAMAWLVISTHPGMLKMAAIGCIGGALAIGAQRTMWRAPVLSRSGSTRR